MESDVSKIASESERNHIQDVTKQALARLLEPLADFVIDAGLSTRDVHTILREATVRNIAARQLEDSRRTNISGIAATTGIPRAEISRILKRGKESCVGSGNRPQRSTNNVLTAWYSEPRYTDSNGQPADLKLYGSGASFERLVKSHCRGIPARAVLEELVRAGAVEILASQKVRARSSFVVDRGITPQAIKAFGDRAAELLSAMLLNMRKPNSPQFVASVFGRSIASNALPLFRRELAAKGAEFLSEIQDNLVQGGSKKSDKKSNKSVSVTVFYYESPDHKSQFNRPPHRRTNFRRIR